MAVYWIGHADSDDPVKIGTGNIAETRRQAGQTWHWKPLEILGELAGDQRLEFALHRRLAPHRVNGEWFERTPALEMLAAISEHGYPLIMGDAHSMMMRTWEVSAAYEARRGWFLDAARTAPQFWFDATSVEQAAELVTSGDGRIELGALSPPAPVCFFDLEGCGSEALYTEPGAKLVNNAVVGALVADREYMANNLGWVPGGDEADWDLMAFAQVQRGNPPLPPIYIARDKGWFVEPVDLSHLPEMNVSNTRSMRDVIHAFAGLASTAVLGAMALLQSANVEACDAPIQRAERRRILRTGAPVPKIVSVRPHSGHRRTGKSGRKIQQRHLVRANFAHYPVATTRIGRLADKTVMHNGVECRRVFRPMHVRGGEHLPFVDTAAWRYTGSAQRAA